MTLEVGTKVRILTDDYVAAGEDFDPESTDPYQGLFDIAAGTEVVIIDPPAMFIEQVEREALESEFGELYAARVDGMLEGDALFILLREEGIQWERV